MFPPHSLRKYTPSHSGLMSAWGGRQTHILKDRSALSSCSPCLEYWTLPWNTEHTVDPWEALRLRGQGQRWGAGTGSGDNMQDGRQEQWKQRTEKLLDPRIYVIDVFQGAQWETCVTSCSVYDTNQSPRSTRGSFGECVIATFNNDRHHMKELGLNFEERKT